MSRLLTFAGFFILTLNSTILGQPSSNWPMFQYDAQHSGYNDKDIITPPLLLLWSSRICPECPVEPVSVYEDFVLAAHSNLGNIIDSLGLFCLNINSGSRIWSHRFLRFDDLLNVDQPSIHDNLVYHMENIGNRSRIAAYDIFSGINVKNITYSAQNDDQLGSIIYNDHLLFPAGISNGLANIFLPTDSVLWFKSLYQSDDWSPSVHKDTVYTWLGGGLQGHDFYTGAQLWWVLPKLGLSGRLGDSSLPAPRRTLASSSFTKESPAVIDTSLMVAYLTDYGELYGVDLRTLEVLWEYNDKANNYNDSITIVSPATYGGVVYTYFDKFFVALDGLSGEVLWRHELDTVSEFHPVIANGYVFASTFRTTYAFDIESHEMVWSYPVSGFLSIANNQLFVASSTGEIHAFGRLVTSTEPEDNDNLPHNYSLNQNYPNPFNPSTNIEFSIPSKSDVTIDIYNIAGQKVRTLTRQQLSAGNYAITWDSRDDHGNLLSTGVYIYKLVAGDVTLKKKMILLK